MALVLLFISFFFSLYGAWIFFSGFFGAETAQQQIAAALSGMAFAVIPYLVGRALSEMVGIRQRHIQIEQIAMQQRMTLEMMEEAARQVEMEENQSNPMQTTQAPKAPPPPAPKS